jgi:hypothetical protein
MWRSTTAIARQRRLDAAAALHPKRKRGGRAASFDVVAPVDSDCVPGVGLPAQCENSASRMMIGIGTPSSQSKIPRPMMQTPILALG